MKCFKTVCIYIVFAITLIVPRARLFAEPAPERPQEGRLLFLIETSAATDNDRTAIRKSLRSILESGLNGNMRYGDTIGLWTYGEKVNTDFPMVMWTHEHLEDAENAIDFWMSKQKFKGRSDFSKLLPSLQKIIKSSQKLTIIWYSTGNEKITGTPFDKEIAELHKEFRDDFRKQHIPFVTLLAVRKGAVVDFTVNPGDAKLRLPEVFEKEATTAAVAATNAPPLQATPPPQASPPLSKKPPLIIRVGPSPDLLAEKHTNALTPPAIVAPTNAPVTNAAVQTLTTNAVAVAHPTVQSNAPGAVSPAPVAKPQTIAQTNSVVAVTNAPAVAPTNASAAAAVKSNSLVAAIPTNNNINGTAKPAPLVEKQKPTAVVPPSAPVPAAAAAVAPQPNYLFIAIGCAVLALIAGAVVFFVKKSNVPKSPSFISQSMTRERFSSDASKPSSDTPAGPE